MMRIRHDNSPGDSMQLIGMLDSPYVRRVAVALRLLDLPFEHRNLSVFRTFEQFRAINPVVKVPTLVCDDGTLLMESGLILEHLEDVAGRSLWPADPKERLRARAIAGLALAAGEKAQQTVYERQLRPPEKRHEPWLARVGTQLAGAFGALEREFAASPLPFEQERLSHAAIATSIVWRFTQLLLPEAASSAAYPALAAFSARVEAQPVFVATPPDENHVAT
jgi:glutathione S-transferase